jgi:RNA recognition motif-containing protein
LNGIHVSSFVIEVRVYKAHIFIAWFRLFVGDLSNDVSDDVLSNAFNRYTSFMKARVIRDRLSGKVGLLS